VLPPRLAKDRKQTFPTAYFIFGFGAREENATKLGAWIASAIENGALPDLVYVLLTGAITTGHHGFADSVNDGPWGRALVEELIPSLEKRFPLVPRASARFLTGHSSGGWSTLWLQITHPEFFGGTWSTSPDPVDFHAFMTFDATPGSTDNVFRTKSGAPRSLYRIGQRDVMSFEDFAKVEAVQGEYGSAIGTSEWVFSPKGDDGRPLKLFDRVTGEQSPDVQRGWERWDIRKVLEANWCLAKGTSISTARPRRRSRRRMASLRASHERCGARSTRRTPMVGRQLSPASEALARLPSCERRIAQARRPAATEGICTLRRRGAYNYEQRPLPASGRTCASHHLGRPCGADGKSHWRSLHRRESVATLARSR
jgi:hypothetical protein